MNKTAYVYVDEHLVSPSLICPICLEILEEPHTHISCDSAFCRSCLLQLAEPLCPICRWTWEESVSLSQNIYLPKASRLIRNMLDDLLVRCVRCHAVRRRGQFEHPCKPLMNCSSPSRDTWRMLGEAFSNLRIVVSLLIVVASVMLTYRYRTYVFVKNNMRQTHIISGIGIDIDRYLLEALAYLLMNLLEHSMAVIMVNLWIWMALKYYGERLLSKSISQLLEDVAERSTILNLIIYSIYH